mmetsp:Transcript_28817/g.75955  ORF Transcript_28817/g.75955 Transcript_28817/m.75955 type:complete len:262 (-) Transcript_28817:74-859(-)|eukprot:CAMPEP_0194517962 /NCGR_PEP_ID=MMETSP0253-20130528/51280_1 /TAXON_ID=2966 /ORGANISM="Noctiluca scintillans" /LENGTH=261 /DNA_ID=CAMNT_0039361977 /DNA_START=36 /DNA_END=821 /DNA_ORIENTATION=-
MRRDYVLAATAVGTVFVLWAWRRKPRRAFHGTSSEVEDLAKLHEFLADLSAEFFNVCREISSVAKSVRARMVSSNINIAEATLCSQLQKQCHVFEKLQAITIEVLEKHGGCSQEAIEELQRWCEGDPKVKAYNDGFKSMLVDCLNGTMPLLPNLTVPSDLNEEKVLDIQRKAQALQLAVLMQKIGGQKNSLEEVNKVLEDSNKYAWTETLRESHELEGGGELIYHGVCALYSRNPEFLKDKEKLEEAHQSKVRAFLRSPQQ